MFTGVVSANIGLILLIQAPRSMSNIMPLPVASLLIEAQGKGAIPPKIPTISSALS